VGVEVVLAASAHKNEVGCPPEEFIYCEGFCQRPRLIR
jgi:hypothetical protein